MCGRYALAWGMRQLRQQMRDAGMDVEDDSDDDEDNGRVRQSYNVAPGNFEPIYRAVVDDNNQNHQGDDQQGSARENEDEEMQHTDESNEKRNEGTQKGTHVKYVLQPMKWGLVPSWTKRNPDYGTLMRTINCRDDSLFGNTGMWTSMKHKKRCIVVAQGFFEWLQKGKDKVPHFTKRTDGQVLCMAGLWDNVRYEDATESLFTYSIITTSSSKQLSFLHDRMPVIFEPGSEEIKMWLDPTRTWDMELQNLLQPWEKPGLECYPVVKEVGKVGNNSPNFIIPLDSKENKNNIKNFFSTGGNKIKTESSEPKDETHSVKTEDNQEEHGMEEMNEQLEDTRETWDDEEASDVNSENNAPLPTPSQPEPEASPIKSQPTTPLLTRTTKRKLAEMSPATTLPPSSTSPSKSPSPLKSQSTYSSTDIGGGPKRGVFNDSPSKKSKTKTPDAKDLGNKNIMSFFDKK